MQSKRDAQDLAIEALRPPYHPPPYHPPPCHFRRTLGVSVCVAPQNMSKLRAIMHRVVSRCIMQHMPTFVGGGAGAPFGTVSVSTTYEHVCTRAQIVRRRQNRERNHAIDLQIDACARAPGASSTHRSGLRHARRRRPLSSQQPP